MSEQTNKPLEIRESSYSLLMKRSIYLPIVNIDCWKRPQSARDKESNNKNEKKKQKQKNKRERGNDKMYDHYPPTTFCIPKLSIQYVVYYFQ